MHIHTIMHSVHHLRYYFYESYQVLSSPIKSYPVESSLFTNHDTDDADTNAEQAKQLSWIRWISTRPSLQNEGRKNFRIPISLSIIIIITALLSVQLTRLRV